MRFYPHLLEGNRTDPISFARIPSTLTSNVVDLSAMLYFVTGTGLSTPIQFISANEH